MKYITQLFRVLVGVLFIVSGFVKLVDPYGTSYKLTEYFSADVLNLTFLQPFVLPLSFIFVVAEVVLGVLLLLGIFKKFTLTNLLLLILFFSFLTFYSAYFNKVTDCGCFGDALKLQPWQTFYKDLVLLVMIIVIIIGHQYIKPIFPPKVGISIALVITLISIGIASWGIFRIPIIDFRPYAIGQDLKENMKVIQEAKIIRFYTLKNLKDNKLKRVSDSIYTNDSIYWDETKWEIQSDLTKDSVIVPEIPAKIHGFEIGTPEKTMEVLNTKTPVYLIINHDELTPDEKERITQFIAQLKQKKLEYYFLTSKKSNIFDNEYEMDGTVLKTINRSSPGVVLIKNGIVIDNWNWRALPF